MKFTIDLLRLFAAFCAVGAGPYLLFAPRRWRRPSLAIPLVINLGMGLIAIVSVHLIAFDYTTRLAFPIAFVCSALAGLLFVTLALLEKITIYPGSLESSPVFGRPLFLLAVTLLAFLPIASHSPGQPFRIGIDEVGYAITAQYLKDGGHWNDLLHRVEIETGYKKSSLALAANCTALSFNDNIASEFILKSLRFGYPSLLAVAASICGERFVADMQMVVLIFPLWLFISIFTDFLEVELGVIPWMAVTLGSVVALNVNLLNVIYEGQHAQMFSTGMMAIVFVSWWNLRQATAGAPIDLRSQVFTAFSLAVILATYSEQILLLLILGVAVTGCDLLRRDIRRMRAGVMLLFSGFAGFLLTFRYGLMWFPFIVAHTANVASGLSGFWQPQWAQATDILGITSIYSPAKPFFVGRGLLATMVLGMVTLAFLDFIVIKVILRKKFQDGAFWIGPVLVVILVFVKSFHLDHVHNYNYMKSYTLLGFPIIVLGFLLLLNIAGIKNGVLETSGRNFWGMAILAVSIIAVALNGLSYLKNYSSEAGYLPNDVEALGDERVAAQLRDAAVLSYRSGGIEFALLAAYCQLNWANIGWADPLLRPYVGKPILLFSLKKDVPNLEKFLKHFQGRTVFNGNDIVIVDTGVRVSLPKSQIGLESMPLLQKVNGNGRPYPLDLTDYWLAIQRDAVTGL